MNRYYHFLLPIVLVLFFACEKPVQMVSLDTNKLPYPKLSDYHFFTGEMKALQPNEKVVPYTLNTPLFSDYAHKARFVWMPAGKSATYTKESILDFPEQTVLIKTFYYPQDFSKPEKDWNIIETRLLVKIKEEWKAYTYIWNKDMTDAELDIVGDTRAMSWKDEQGKTQEVKYLIPNKNQCKSCHNSQEKLQPIGPKANNLNKAYAYSSQETKNQLEKWAEVGYLTGYNKAETQAKMPDWADKNAPLDARARAYLEVNCGHCHNEKGPGGSSGLSLTYQEMDIHKIGLCKSPVATGRGSEGLLYDIHPQSPDSSILLQRMISNDPGNMMPEIGRGMIHTEGVELIRAWIKGLEGKCK
ncbi:MAG: SO2930 family diheme c-type cytochrome [Bacteroidia bacterium]